MSAKEVQIGEKTFFITKINALDGMVMFADLQNEILPALGGAINGFSSAKGMQENDLGGAIAALSSTIDGSMLKKWCDKLLCDGNVVIEKSSSDVVALSKNNLDLHFDDFTEIIELMIIVALENFKAPLAKLPSRIGLGSLSMANLSESIATKS